MPRGRSLLITNSFLALLSIAFAGCEEDHLSSPACRTGQILGSITGAGRPLQATVAAQSVGDPAGSPFVRFEARTDSSGAYVVPVVPGRYIVRVLVEHIWCCASGNVAGGSLSHTEADTFVVRESGGPVRVDVNLGAVLVRASVPAQLEGQEIQGILKLDEVEGRDWIYTFGTAANGRVDLAFPAVNPGRYKVRFNAGNTGIWLPGSYIEADGDWVNVEAGRESIYETQVPERGMVYGTVTGSWQRLNQIRPWLRLFDSDSSEVAADRTTWEGSYELWILAPVRARLAIGIGGYWRWYGGDRFEDATDLDLRPGEATEINFVESGIAGEIGQGGSSGISLHDESGAYLATSGLAGETGQFSFANLLPGTYFVQIARGPSWIAQWYDHVDSFEQATPIHVAGDGQVVWLDPILMEGARISGRVLDPEGEPIIGAVVDVTAATDSAIWLDRQTRTRDAGQFDVPALPNGSFKVRATTGGLESIWYPGVVDWDSAGAITIEDYGDVTGIDLQFR